MFSSWSLPDKLLANFDDDGWNLLPYINNYKCIETHTRKSSNFNMHCNVVVVVTVTKINHGTGTKSFRTFDAIATLSTVRILIAVIILIVNDTFFVNFN